MGQQLLRSQEALENSVQQKWRNRLINYVKLGYENHCGTKSDPRKNFVI